MKRLGKKGVTIAELIVAATLTIVIAGWMVGAYITGYTNWERARIHAELQQTASIYMQRIVRGMEADRAAFNEWRNGLQEAESFTIVTTDDIEYIGTDSGLRNFFVQDRDGDGATEDDIFLMYSTGGTPVEVFSNQALTTNTPRRWLRDVTFADADDQPDHDSLVSIRIRMRRPLRGRDIDTELNTMVSLRN